MGVHSLWEILGPTARPVRLEALSRKKLAVDASIWIYQFLKAVRDGEGNAMAQSHIVGFFRRICKLLYFGIQPIFVFDGGAPALKRETINQRKQRRQGKSETTKQTAQKLLAIQIQRQAEKYHESQRKPKKIDIDADDDAIYLDDLPIKHPMHSSSSQDQEPKTIIPATSRFVKNDEYHLPEIKEFNVSAADARIMPEDEFNETFADFDHVDGIDINTVDPNSKEFLLLPIGTQYMVLSHLRLKSRLRMGFRKDQLEALFPNSMDFSKFQIQQVQKRNFYTQKLMDVAGMGDDGNATKRIAGDKDRKYALIKNDDGWTLSIADDSSEKEPIVLDEDGNEVKNPFAAQPKIEIKSEIKNNEIQLPDEKKEPKEEEEEEDSDDDFEDVALDIHETEEEKKQQQAIIESIYQQYNEPGSQGIPASDGFHEDDLRKAVENSRKDLAELYKKEKELSSKPAAESTSEDFSLGGSFLFPIAKPKHTINSSAPEKLHPEAIKASSFRGSILFGTEKKESSKLEEKTKPKEANIKDVEIVPQPQEESIIDVSDEEHAEEIKRNEHKSRVDTLESSSEKTIVNQPVPTWFNEDSSQIKNAYNQEQFYEGPRVFSESQNEDEDAGLIPWNEARDILSEDKQGHIQELSESEDSSDDIREIAPIEQPKKSNTDKDISEKSSKSEDGPEEVLTGRKAQIIDYDFEQEDEENVVAKLRVEEDDHETFKSTMKKTYEIPLSSINSSVTEEQLLQEKLHKAKRDAEEVTQTMISDVQELLRRFGIPYITAPMEAEAQCAELLNLNLVDGIITDDSDCFLFGGDRVYKNMFNQKQYVECYIRDEIQDKVGLTQDRLIELALLLGSDYTEGIKGVGPVLAMEILAEFGSLKKFKKWFDNQTKSAQNKSKADLTGLEKTLIARIKSGKLFLPDSFPDPVVFAAYKSPEVDHDKSQFKWGVPSLDQIRSFLMYNVSWSQSRVDEVMVPLIRDMNRKKQEGTQSTIGEFFPQEYIKSRKELNLGKRIKSAANKLNKRTKIGNGFGN